MHITKKILITGMMMLMFSGSVMAQTEDFGASAIAKKDIVALSVLYPGLGQMTRGEKAKGFTIFLAETISLLTFINSHENYSTKLISYNRDLGDLNSIGTESMKTYDQAKALYNSLVVREKMLEDLDRTRKVAIGVAAGIYLYNIVDVLFIGKNVTQSNEVGYNQNKINIQPTVTGNNYGILLSKSF